MNAISGASLAEGMQEVAGVFCFRAIPVAGWALLAPRMTRRVRIAGAAAAVVLGAAALLSLRSLILPLALAYGYFSVTACAVPWLAGVLRRGGMSAAAGFAVCAFAFFIAPALYAPSLGKATVLLVGWDIMLSSYSYCIEGARHCKQGATAVAGSRGWRVALEDCLFFLLINPALVYTQRGHKSDEPALNLVGLRRMAVGLCVILVVTVLIRPAGQFVDAKLGAQWLAGTALPVAVFVSGFFALLVNYLQQSSVASLEIGMLRQLGYVVPERFNRPLLATGPLDFWRRWNTYVGGWMQRYVFLPASLRLVRGPLNAWPAWVSITAGVLVTFAAVGVLHDVVPYFLDARSEARGLFVFASAGVLVIVWAGAKQLTDVFTLPRLATRLISWPIRVFSRLTFALAMFALFAWWTP